MNWDRIEGNWKQVTGKVKEQWGKLTDDDSDVVAGRRDQLGVIQTAQGLPIAHQVHAGNVGEVTTLIPARDE